MNKIKSSKRSSLNWNDGKVIHIRKNNKTKLIVAFSQKRATNDEHNRKRGLQRLEKRIKSGKLTKSNIYNKYLKLRGKLTIEIDYEKFKADQA